MSQPDPAGAKQPGCRRRPRACFEQREHVGVPASRSGTRSDRRPPSDVAVLILKPPARSELDTVSHMTRQYESARVKQQIPGEGALRHAPLAPLSCTAANFGGPERKCDVFMRERRSAKTSKRCEAHHACPPVVSMTRIPHPDNGRGRSRVLRRARRVILAIEHARKIAATAAWLRTRRVSVRSTRYMRERGRIEDAGRMQQHVRKRASVHRRDWTLMRHPQRLALGM